MRKMLKVIGWVLLGSFCLASLLTLTVPWSSSWVIKIDNIQEFQAVQQGNPDKAIWFVGLKASIYTPDIYELTVKSHPQWETFWTGPKDRIPPWLASIDIECIGTYTFENEYMEVK